MLKVKVTTKGGRKLSALLKKAKASRGVRAVDVGFFGSKYPGKDVTDTEVAARQEFGTKAKDGPGIPERPFFRAVLPTAKRTVRRIVKDGVDTRTLTVDEQLGRRVGGTVAGLVKNSIVSWSTPTNAEATEKRKGRNDPLVQRDAGVQRQLQTGEVTEEGRECMEWQVEKHTVLETDAGVPSGQCPEDGNMLRLADGVWRCRHGEVVANPRTGPIEHVHFQPDQTGTIVVTRPGQTFVHMSAATVDTKSDGRKDSSAIHLLKGERGDTVTMDFDGADRVLRATGPRAGVAHVLTLAGYQVVTPE